MNPAVALGAVLGVAGGFVMGTIAEHNYSSQKEAEAPKFQLGDVVCLTAFPEQKYVILAESRFGDGFDIAKEGSYGILHTQSNVAAATLSHWEESIPLDDLHIAEGDIVEFKLEPTRPMVVYNIDRAAKTAQCGWQLADGTSVTFTHSIHALKKK